MSTSGDLHITADLLRQVADGDQAAFATLFNTTLPLLRPGIIKLAQSEEVFREIVQECFLKVWLHRDQLPEIEKPLQWIYRIAANECFSWLNKEALRHKKLRQFENSSSTVAGDADVSQLLGFKETQALVRQAIDALPEKKKSIYLESRVSGLKTIEIAEKLRVSHSYVRNSISEALQFIREHLRKAGHLTLILSMLRTFF